MFDCLEQLELFAACFLQLRRTLVDLIPDRMSFIVDKNCIILLFCTQIPAVTINILLCSLKKLYMRCCRKCDNCGVQQVLH